MSADLTCLNGKHPTKSLSVQVNSRITNNIIRLFAYTMVSVLIGAGIALLDNWHVRLNETEEHLVRSANMANFLVETDLAIAEKSLKTTQAAFTDALQVGPIDRQLASQLLDKSYQRFKTFNDVDMFGLVFFVDSEGMLVARSGLPNTDRIDFSDRYYYYQLRDHPDVTRAIGPMVYARTTKLWLFHISVPLHDKDGKFAGVLVQQLSEANLASHLARYADTQNFDQLMTHLTDGDASFVFPAPGAPTSPSEALKRAPMANAHSNGGAIHWDEATHEQSNDNPSLVQVVKSPMYDLETYATFSKSKLRHEFWIGNLSFLLYVAVGVSVSTALFYYLFNLSKQLASAQEASMFDPLTKVHNRRALDEVFPVLVSDAMRSQEPLSVLFIDIDHFRFFNTQYGHESGDTALIAVAQTLATCASRPLDFVCRWGGEEFVIVLPKTNGQAAMKISHEILNAIRAIELQSENGEHPSITVSIGYVTDTITSIETQDDLINEADTAMRQAKKQGRDQCVAYTREG